jgi:predicted PurR-regulated permease PerM
VSDKIRPWLVGLVFSLIIGWLLYLLAPVLTPFLFSALLAYLGDPIVDRLEAWKFSRTMAVVTVFLTIILSLLILLLFLVPLLEGQVRHLIQRLPAYLDWFQAKALPWLRDGLGIDPGLIDLSKLRTELLQYVDKVGGLAAGLVYSITKSSTVVLSWLINLLLIPVVTFYLLRDWDILVARIQGLLPRRIEPIVVNLVKESNEVLGAFLRGQFLVMVALGTIYSLGLAVIGLDFASLIGMLAGLLSFIPYLGFIVGVTSAGIASLLQFYDLIHLLLVIVVFGIGQVIESMLLTPKLVGDCIGLHPVAVIFAMLAGGHLFGFFGILLALPAAAVIMVLLRHTHDEYLRSVFYEN